MTEIQNHALCKAPLHLTKPTRTPFAALVDEASDALGLDATEEEKQRLGHWIVGAWEDQKACSTCTKNGDDVLACGQRTLIREDGIIRPVTRRCEKYHAVCVARRTARLFGKSHLGERFRTRTFGTFRVTDDNKTAYQACRALADNFTPGTRGLFLSGGCGTGKTHLAGAIVHTLIRKGHHAMLMTTNRLLDTLKSAFGDTERTARIKEELATCDLLVLDDIGAEHISDWAKSELFNLLNERYEMNKTTILTTNLSIDALAARLGQRTISRIAEMTDGIRIVSDDHRLRRHLERRPT